MSKPHRIKSVVPQRGSTTDDIVCSLGDWPTPASTDAKEDSLKQQRAQRTANTIPTVVNGIVSRTASTPTDPVKPSYCDILSGKAQTMRLSVEKQCSDEAHDATGTETTDQTENAKRDSATNEASTASVVAGSSGPVRKNNKPTKNVNLSDFIFIAPAKQKSDKRRKVESNAMRPVPQKQKEPVIRQKSAKTVPVGNILDSSTPLLHKGKTKTSAKKPTKLKKVVLKDRESKNTPDATEVSHTDESVTQGEEPQTEPNQEEEPLPEQNAVTQELNDAVLALLQEVKRFQDRLWSVDPNKARLKRRVVVGLHEVQKHLNLNGVGVVFLAPNIEQSASDGGLDQRVTQIRRLCHQQNVLCIYALSKTKLGKAVKKFSTTCVAILNYQGAEVLYKNVLEALEQSSKPHVDAKVVEHQPISGAYNAESDRDKNWSNSNNHLAPVYDPYQGHFVFNSVDGFWYPAQYYANTPPPNIQQQMW